MPATPSPIRRCLPLLPAALLALAAPAIAVSARAPRGMVAATTALAAIVLAGLWWSLSRQAKEGAALAERMRGQEQAAEDLAAARQALLGELRRAAADASQARSDAERARAEAAQSRAEADQSRAEAERARAEAAEAAQAKGGFLATISHEFRTPLNGVVGMAGLLLDSGGLDPQQREYAETVRTCGENLRLLVGDVLDYARIEAGQLALELAEVDVAQVAEDAIGLVAGRAQAKGLELVCDLDPGLPELVHGDGQRLRQVLVNLLGNGVKFTDRGQVCLRVQAEAAAGDRARIGIAVEDTGIGLSSQVMPRLFAPFTQADSTTTRRFGGTGLGLAICRRLVELMGGTITGANRPHGGARFAVVLDLPVCRGAGDPPGLAAEVLAARGLSALVACERPATGEALARQLRAWGMVVTVADDGRGAVAALHQGIATGIPVRLVLVDQDLPGMDGPALAQLASGDPQLAATGVILLTGPGPAPVGLDRSDRVVGILAKPVRRALLAQAVAAALRQGDPARSPDEGPVPDLAARILVAEDNGVNQRVVLALLARLGCRADGVANGREVLAAVAAVPYDAVLLDCQMPEMDGFEAARELRRREAGGSRLPLIALTASGQAADRDRCLAAGMDDHLVKPVGLHLLADALRRHLPASGRRRESVGGMAAPAIPGPAVVGKDAPLVDSRVLTDLVAQLGEGGEGVVADLIGDFLDEAPAVYGRLEQAVTARDANLVKARAHRLRGLCLTVGLPAATAHATTLEQAGLDGRTGEVDLDGPLSELRRLLPLACAQLTRRRSELRA